MARTHYQTLEIERDGEHVEVEFEYEATAYVPTTYWQPAEGGEIEIINVKVLATGEPIDNLYDDDDLLTKLSENHEDDLEEYLY